MAKRARSTYGMALAGALALLALVAWLAPFVSPLAQAAEGAEDTTSPTVNSISIGSSEVAAGETLTLTMDVTEEGMGFTEIYVGFRHCTMGGNEEETTNFSKTFTYGEPQYSNGSLVLKVPIPENAEAGNWYIYTVQIEDQKHNQVFYVASPKEDGTYELGIAGEGKPDIASPVFTVKGDVATDTVAPILTGLRIVTPDATVERPGSIRVEVAVRDEESGLGYAYVSVTPSSTKTPAFTRGASASRKCTEAERAAGKMVLEIPIDAQSYVGEWQIDRVEIRDMAGNATSVSVTILSDEGGYDWIEIDGQLQPVPRFTVTGSGEFADDLTAPEVTSVRILNEGPVNRPGIVQVEVSFREEESGIAKVEAQIGPWNAGDGSNLLPRAWGYRESFSTEEFSASRVVVDVPVASTDPLGDWCVHTIWLVDKAGNTSALSIGPREDGSPHDWYFIDGEYIRIPHFEVREEFNFQLEMALSNPRLIGSLENLGEGEAARILIDDDAVLPKEALDAIAGRDVTLVLYKDDYQWVVRGTDIEGETKDVVLSLELWQETGDEYGSGDDVVHLVFYPNGELPCPMQVRFKSDYLYSYAGISGALHLYYLDDGELVEEEGNIDLVFDGTDKWCYFDVTHNSEFIISTKVQAAGGSVPDAGQGGSAAGAGQGNGSDAKSPDGFAKETVGDDKIFSDKTQGTASQGDLPQAGDGVRLLAGSLMGLLAGLLGLLAVAATSAFRARRRMS